MSSCSMVTPLKSATDKRDYRCVTLDNGLSVVLCSDVDTDKSACALDVGVGSWCDPDEVLGLAHFLEHMCFLGTERFPDENSFDTFLKSHGGMSNAFTAQENTNYMFDVTKDHLEEALDRFSSFFSCPLFTESATDRELNAVHSENDKNLQSDVWRLYQLLKYTSDPSHPFHRFSTGNLETLKEMPLSKGTNVREHLIDFHKRLYSANIMKCAIVGKEPLDTLEAWATRFFGTITTHDIARPSFVSGTAFPSSRLQKRFNTVPVKDLRRVSIMWPLPPLRKDNYLDSKPDHYISHLLGHEAEGSILSLLKQKGWATDLSAGAMESTQEFSLFEVSADLTPEGEKHVDDIVHIIYQYLELMKAQSSEDWQGVYDEIASVAEMQFRFKSKENPVSYVSQLASSMHTYPADRVLSGSWLFRNHDEPLVRDTLSQFTPERMRVSLISKKVEEECSDKEPWYKTPFSESPLSPELVQRCGQPGATEHLHLPTPNDFIATDFTIVDAPGLHKDEDSVPQSLHQEHTDTDTAFFKVDTRFNKPKACIATQFISPVAWESPEASVMTSLFISCLNQVLNEYAYVAEVAGLSYKLKHTNEGMKLLVGGYNQKMQLLVEKILERMVVLPEQLEDQVFERVKEKLVRSLDNWSKEQPYLHSMHNATLCLTPGEWTVEAKREAIKGVTREKVSKHARQMLRSMKTETLAHGNLREEDATRYCKHVKDTLRHQPVDPSQLPEYRVVALPAGKTYSCEKPTPNAEDANSAVVSYYQVGEATVKSMCVLDLFSRISQNSCFNALRTQQQLGYIVWSGAHNHNRVLGFRVIVQSSTHSGRYVEGRIEAWMEQMRQELDSMSDDTFSEFKTAYLDKLQEKYRSLGEETQFLWNCIYTHQYDWDLKKQQLEVAQSLTKADLLTFFDHHLRINSDARRKMVSIVQAQAEPTAPPQADSDDNQVELAPVPEDTSQRVDIDDIDAFVRSMPLHASYMY